MLFREGRRTADDGAVVTLDMEGDGVEVADEDGVAVGPLTLEEADMVDGSGVSVEDIVCIGIIDQKMKRKTDET